ncbi:MAG: heme-binding protein [Pseudonocardiaceae bacterium]
MPHIFRAAGSVQAAADMLGFLQDLPGRWQGNGFNLIARPAKQGDPANPIFFLELNATQETLEFTAIGGDIPNRGDIEPTRLLHGIHYLQTVVDCADGSFIHKEPGVWIHVPATSENTSETYVRLATIPHGDSLVAQSSFLLDKPGGPKIDPVTTFPFPIGDPIPPLNDLEHAVLTSPNYLAPYLNDPLPVECLPSGLDPATTIKDPTEVLRKQIQGQDITNTIVIEITTSFPSPLTTSPVIQGIVNIPFVVANVNATQMDAIFWIEKITNPTLPDQDFLQLQYVQRVILDFAGLHWPHVSVATLIKTG